MKIFSLVCALLFVFASQTSYAQDCEGPAVGFGEIMAGLQAGFTGAGLNENAFPSGLYLATSGTDQRGFIDPETGSGWICDGDWGLVSMWFGVAYGSPLSRKLSEARELAENLVSIVIEVDSVEHGAVETAAKKGSLPLGFGDRDAVIKTWGVFLEPYSLLPGVHSAEAFFRFDLDCLPSNAGQCDGIYETDVGSIPTEFEVLPN